VGVEKGPPPDDISVVDLVRCPLAYVGVEKGPPPDDISVIDWLGALQRMWVLRKVRLLMTCLLLIG